MNKSIVTNIIALLDFITGYALNQPIVLTVGLFAVSGAITNWLAVHMLFEKVPGLYGSGVIPARFEDFKAGIHKLMMTQFFNDENIDRFVQKTAGVAANTNLSPIIEKVDLSPSFEALVEVIKGSSFGSMLGMLGGEAALQPLKEPFIAKMKVTMINMVQSEEFIASLQQDSSGHANHGIKDTIEEIVSKRLEELTPELVKEIIQDMIRKHLGWLVVWGGIFGGAIGLAAAFLK
ncbi:MAG: DUF445 domain-containing protein [Psychrosphaera sp.]|nr:DUF445 domain-containing protein [Psychrosphaera sp.]